jgi:uracil-DNA glycosylase
MSFLRRQIEIVRPRAVVGLGAKAFQSCLNAFSKERISLSEAINDRDGIELVAGVRLFAAYHCGARTLAINRSLDQQVGDWKRIAKFIARAN